jgi:hypothetical protein
MKFPLYSQIFFVVYAFAFSLQISIPEGPNKFTILSSEKHDVSKIQIGFDGPSQPDCKLVTKKDKTIDVTYTAPVAGEYKIHVRYEDKPIPGSPFKCKIIGDVSSAVGKMKISGDIKEGKINSNNSILIDGREVGILGTSMSSSCHVYVISDFLKSSSV